jgi:anti-sigma factor RsiW
MSVSCTSPIAWESLVDYWAGDLAQHEQDVLEEHVMGCERCASASARVAAMTEAFRAMIPPLLTPETLARLHSKGLRILENPMHPGERKQVLFPANVDVLLHRLGGLDLAHATRVSFTLRVESTAHVLIAIDDAVFDRNAGAVLVACQMHFASLPPDTVAEIRTLDESGVETVREYTILHRFESAPPS